MTTKIENQKLEKDDGKQTNVRSENSKLDNYDGSQVKLVQNDITDSLNGALTIDGMQGNQNYSRHVSVHVFDGKLGTKTQKASQVMFFGESIMQPVAGVNGQPNHFIHLAASSTSESQNNTAQSSVHQSFLPYPPFTGHKQDGYQSFLQMSSTFSSLIASTLLQNPAAHAAASFATTFWPYGNPETSSDSARCSQGDFPSKQICSPPSVEAIAAATVAAASAWWTAHGLLPLCAPLLTAFSHPPASVTSVPSMITSEAPAPKTKQAKTTLLLDPKYLEAQHSASVPPAIILSDSENGDVKLNVSSNAAHHEMNKAISEHLDSNKMKGRKQVDRSSCGSNTTSSNEVETDALEKDEKGDKEPGLETPDVNHLATEFSNRRSRTVSNFTDSWKEVSEEGKLAFQALFSRQVLPQSFSSPQGLKNKEHQVENIKDNNKQNTDGKDEEDLDNRKCCSNYEGVQRNLPFVENDEGLLTIGLGQAKLKTRRTGFKPYKRCSMEAKENRIGTTSIQGEEKGCKRIRLEGGAST